MNLEFLVVCGVVGVGTYLFRYLPTRIGARAGAKALSGRLGACLAAVGGAWGAALLAASYEPHVLAAVSSRQFGAAAAAVLALATTFLLFRWRKDAALATMCGAAVYGLALWLMP